MINVPFIEVGEILPAKVYQGYTSPRCKWVERGLFEESLTFNGFTRGRSSAKFKLMSKRGDEYEMFLKDVSDMIGEIVSSTGANHEYIFGVWKHVKRGSNYGIKLVKLIDVCEDDYKEGLD
jgi:hypothetical protein